MADKLTDFSTRRLIDQALIDHQMERRELLYEFNHSRPGEHQKRRDLLKQILGHYEGTHIEPPFRCDMGSQLSIGKGGFINYGLIVLDIAPVSIGNHVLIGPNVQLCAASHPILLSERVQPFACGDPIQVGNHVWIGAGSIVLGGISIGENTVIGAGSMVTQDIPPNVVAVGNPCRVIRTIEQGDIPTEAEIQALYQTLGVGDD
ncbi:sugar O-acetyltransferase [Photobacterium sp. 1_MG-2023]|uniref:sugar O-acetyltransferase n=1 Tax=Photobacterium sp. 1_MG-2023 TaxID=3062646 RepID=UPI0026E1D9C0|nr:sugar O-acetyltransferase [Photobacterium sp. 1_MG-2023]MDO6707522.1 sugar O-acetyltransferase [Photobacterium sp. 1_MG-2023]